MAAYLAWDELRARAIIAEELGRPGPELPMLHAIQAAFGYVPEAAVPLIADAVNRSRAEIHGVVTFYHDFRREPPARHVLKLCRAEACQAMGADALAAEAERRRIAADGRVMVEPVYCLGLCSVAPAAMLDGIPAGRLDGQRLAEWLDEAGR